jgi:hypothetical protein
MTLLNMWHTKLAMPMYDKAWHQQDLEDELAEYNAASGIIDRWSELSDVVYTYTRAHWSGHTSIEFPLARWQLYLGVMYMIPKYTLRWRFFRKLGYQFDKNLRINEVRNPEKVHKLKVIAEKYKLPVEQFQAKAEALLKKSWLLK